MTKEDLYEAALTALAAGAGGVDETLFGLPQKYSESVRKLKKDSPTAFGVGQVGSYFIPGTGITGGIRAALKAPRALKGVVGAIKGGKGLREILGALKVSDKAARGGKEMGALAKVLLSGTKAGAEGAVEGGGQVLARRALGTGEGSAEEEAISGGLSGAVLGGASPALGKLAKNIYSHPKITSGKGRSREVVDRLLDEGIYGGEETFRKYAKGAKDNYEEILAPYRKKLSGKKLSFDDVVGEGTEGFAAREYDAKRYGRKGLAKQFKETREQARDSMGTDPKFGDVLDYLKGANTQLSDLSAQKRAKSLGGRGQKEDAAIGAMKSSIDNLEENLMGARFGDEGTEAIGRARKEYGTGREIERSMDDWNPQESADWIKSISKPATSLPVRTGLGSILNKVAKTPGKAAAKVGRASEYINREEPAYRIKDGNVETTSTGKAYEAGEDPFADIRKEISAKPKSKENKIVKDGKRTGELDDIWKELE